MRKTMIKLAAVAAIALGTLAVDGVNSREAQAGCISWAAGLAYSNDSPYRYEWPNGSYVQSDNALEFAFWFCYGLGNFST